MAMCFRIARRGWRHEKYASVTIGVRKKRGWSEEQVVGINDTYNSLQIFNFANRFASGKPVVIRLVALSDDLELPMFYYVRRAATSFAATVNASIGSCGRRGPKPWTGSVAPRIRRSQLART